MNKQEEILQAKCYQWFHNTYPQHRKMLFHVDNNSWNEVIGSKKKALGVNSGVSDLVLILNDGRVVWIEMKTPDGVQSDNQIDFERKLIERRHRYIIIDTFDDFKNLICQSIGK